jgi:hypothetical protein
VWLHGSRRQELYYRIAPPPAPPAPVRKFLRASPFMQWRSKRGACDIAGSGEVLLIPMAQTSSLSIAPSSCSV